MKVVTTDEMRAIDRRTYDEYHVPSLNLMEAAGSACAGLALEAFPTAHKILVVCGKGNNGGDGFVAARKLRQAGKDCRVVLLTSPEDLKGDAAVMFARMDLPVEDVYQSRTVDWRLTTGEWFMTADLILDAILGTGFRPPVTGLYAVAIEVINHSGVPVLAVDIPSGADSDSYVALADVAPVSTGAPATRHSCARWGERPAVVGASTPAQASQQLICRADAIATFTAPRPAHVFGNLTHGQIRVAPIGSPDAAIQSSLNLHVITALDAVPLLAPRLADSNKGKFGHALIIGGSVGKSGSVAMSGLAALRVGAGLSTVATAKSAMPTVAAHACEVMTEPLSETETGTISSHALRELEGLLPGKNVIAIGPGISRHPDTVHFVHSFVHQYREVPLVIDADGLNAFEHDAAALDGRGRTLVLTPHPGEMARLAGVLSAADIQRDRLSVARKFASEHHLVLVLKGWRTLVALPDGAVWVNPTGNPGMATGGTGDVLTGMIAGFLAQFPNDVARAVCVAVYLHGLAGDVAREAVGEQSMIAGDLMMHLPGAFRMAKQRAEERITRIQ